MNPLRFVLPLFCCTLLSTSATADVPEASVDRVDRILVVKSERKMYLQSAGRTLRTFDISLGLVPEGAKQREGDFRTPEGVYYIESKNARSDFFLALKVSYPNEQDRARAREKGIDPGGQIMIHGLPNAPKYPESRYLGTDWTDGCIAVSNSDMVDLWLMTSVAMPIEIRP
jgi:murein L,D-transpeptidase YafK